MSANDKRHGTNPIEIVDAPRITTLRIA